mgnify:CR=1 FL=1
MSLKNIIKQIGTCVLHPYVASFLLVRGCKHFIIGPQLTINGIRGFKNFKCGNDFSMGRNGRLLFVDEYRGRQYTPEIIIGDNVCIGNRFSCLSAAKITIDDNCLIASDVMISSENHGTNPEFADSYSDTPLDAKEVWIGKGCWIGEKVSILPGVSIGDRCIIATNAVVTKSFPSYCLIGGVPAKLLKKYNFEKHQWEKVNEKSI